MYNTVSFHDVESAQMQNSEYRTKLLQCPAITNKYRSGNATLTITAATSDYISGRMRHIAQMRVCTFVKERIFTVGDKSGNLLLTVLDL